MYWKQQQMHFGLINVILFHSDQRIVSVTPSSYLLPQLLTYLLTYSMKYSPPWQATWFSQLVKKFPALYGTRRFITAFKKARHLSLLWASSIQSMPLHPTSLWSILILSSHLNLDFEIVSFRQVSPPNHIYISPPPCTCYMLRLSHSSRLDHPNNTGWRVQIIKLIIMQFPPLPCYFVPLRHKYSIRHLDLKRPQPSSSLNVSDQVSHPYKTTGKSTVQTTPSLTNLDHNPLHIPSVYCTSLQRTTLQTTIFNFDILHSSVSYWNFYQNWLILTTLWSRYTTNIFIFLHSPSWR